MSGGKGKRGPSWPIIVVTTSDDDDEACCPLDDDLTPSVDQPPAPSETPVAVTAGRVSECDVGVSPTPLGGSPTPVDASPTPVAVSPCLVADHDYDNVSSPSSTASEPASVYARQPGFTLHAHTVVVDGEKAKRKKSLVVVRGGRRREPTPPKCRPKRDPLPMRMRALPQSFFQQPNRAHNVSPGASYPILPPLCNRETGEDVADVRPISPSSDSERWTRPPRPPERKTTVPNTDLLLRLFDGIEQKQGRSHTKRGRPRKTITPLVVASRDPYLVDCVSGKLFPQLSLDQQASTRACVGGAVGGAGGGAICGQTPALQLIVVREGDKSILLPSLSFEQNYPQMLSELVLHI